MSLSNERHSRFLDDIANKILIDPYDKKATSTTTTKVGNNNEIVMEGREELEFEVVSQHEEEDDDDEDVVADAQKPPVQTLVFFDVEATGLSGSTSKARITELSLVAVSTTDLLDMTTKLSTRIPSEDFEQVSIRVINKLTLCVNPNSLIMPKITEMTGLDNYNLETQKNFTDRTVLILESFLQHLPKPVCLVAHHGLGFDFPLLRSELLKSESDLDPEILVVDSLEAFKHIFAEQDAADAVELASQSKHEPIFDDDDDALFLPLLDDVDPPEVDQVFTHKEVLENSQYPSASSTPVKSGEKRRKTYQLPLTPPTTSSKRSRLEDSLISPTINNSSSINVEPAPSHVKELLEAHSTNELRDDNEVTPDRSSNNCPRSFGAPVKARKFAPPPDRLHEVSRARKRLDFSRTSPKSFSLANIYTHFYGKAPAVSHGAEEDCLTLMRICAAQGNSFVSYVEKNAQPFSRIEKMW